ncbi:MAG TPA: type II and III secretion system protein family protein [Methylotenera sp.]|nr:type II and III secretion system protein family protein [Methylotenera sp.]
MFKPAKKAINPNISRKIALLCVGLAILNTPAFARKNEPKKVAISEAQAMIGEGRDSSCLGQVSSPAKLTLPLGKSTLVKLPEPVASRTVGNQGVVQAKMIAPQTLYLLGIDIGSTNMIIQGKSGTCTIIDVTVSMDPDGLQQTLNELLPEEKNIKVTAAADSLILSGTVEDAITANRAVDIASAYVRRKTMAVDASKDGGAGSNLMNQQNNMGNQSPDTANPRIVNMLSVSAQQQVMLEVKIAEVSKTLLDKLGASATLGGKYGLITSFLSNSAGLLGKLKGNGIYIDAENKDGLVKILAEPTIMAISGQEGSFLAGGKIFIPVAQNNIGGGNTITLEEKEFGVGLKFTPTVLAGGRINMRVSPEVSELDKNGIGITATGFSGTAILPSFTTRRASTTVQLYDGQSFAIGGLIKNNTTANIKAFPILGEIPILGALFRSTEFQKDKTELIFVVTPHLVKPLASNNYRLPTDRYVDPSRSDVFLKGKMEGTLPPDAPPPVTIENKTDAVKPKEPVQENDSGFDVR